MTIEIFHVGYNSPPKGVHKTINPNEREEVGGLEILNRNTFPVYVRIK